MERNPARARWNILKRKIRDGTFFVLTREASIQPTPSYRVDGVDFDQVISQIQMNLNNASLVAPRSVGLNGQHAARAMNTPGGAPAYEQYTQSNALRAMSTFMDSNKKAIRRLSKLPVSTDLQHLVQAYGSLPQTLQAMPTPPSSRPTSRSPSSSSSTRMPLHRHRSRTNEDAPQLLQRRNTATSDSVRSDSNTAAHVSPVAAMSALMMKMNTRTKSITSPVDRQTDLIDRDRVRSMHSFSFQKPTATGPKSNGGAPGSAIGVPTANAGVHTRSLSMTGSLRAFRLQASAMAGGMNRRSDVSRT